jgi:hypothetical protein
MKGKKKEKKKVIFKIFMYLGVVGCCFLKEVNIAVIVPSF